MSQTGHPSKGKLQHNPNDAAKQVSAAVPTEKPRFSSCFAGIDPANFPHPLKSNPVCLHKSKPLPISFKNEIQLGEMSHPLQSNPVSCADTVASPHVPHSDSIRKDIIGTIGRK